MFEGVFLLKQIDFWTRPSQLNQTVDIEVSDEDFKNLSFVLKEHAGMEFTIQIDNLQQLINEQLEQNEASARNDNWHASYHPLNEVGLKEVTLEMSPCHKLSQSKPEQCSNYSGPSVYWWIFF